MAGRPPRHRAGGPAEARGDCAGDASPAKSYRSPRQLALALADKVPEAARAIRDGVLDTWLRRDLREPARAKALADLVGTASGRTAEPLVRTDDALVAQAALLLDPGLAIRYRGAAFLADGFATALAAQMIQGGSVQALAEALTLKFPEAQIAAQAEAAPDDALRLRQFREWAAYLKDPRYGYGIERCLYEANPRLPCLSPLLRAHCVIDLAGPDPDARCRRKFGSDGDQADRPPCRRVHRRPGDPRTSTTCSPISARSIP